MLIKGRSTEARNIEPSTSLPSNSKGGVFGRQVESERDGRFRQSNAAMGASSTSLEQFMAVVDWVMNQRSESAYARFCLFRIVFENPQTLGSTFGAAEAMRRLNQFGTLLASAVRHTDLVARDRSVFWTLTPECNAAILCSRLNDIVAKVEELGLDVVPCSVGAHVFPLEYAEISNARMLLDHLASLPPDHRFAPAADYAVA